MLILTSKTLVFSAVVVSMKPEKKPPVVAGSQGLLKSPMTMLWFPVKNSKERVSPTAAVMLVGEMVKPPLPTMTGMVLAAAPIAIAAAAAIWRGEGILGE